MAEILRLNKAKIGSLSNVVLLTTMFLVVVFPNTFRGIKVGLFGLLFLYIHSYFFKMPKKVSTVYLAGIIITFIYLFVGLSKAQKPLDSTPQVILVYILSPLFWLLLSLYVIKNFSINAIIKILNVYAIAGSITVLIAIWLYNHGYKEILDYIIENPNQAFTEAGVTGIRLNVYGSLVFLFPASLQLSYKFKGIKFIFLTLLILIIAIVSGRDSLRLSVLIGLFMLVVLNRGVPVKYSVYIIPAIFVFLLILDYYGISISNTMSQFVDKIEAGGGTERTDQYYYLLEGIDNNHLLGSGHGVGVSLVRSPDYPWRYELLSVATIYRVGIIGFLVYALPAILSTITFIKKFFTNSNTSYDNYFFAGLISLCVASFTNNYFESFEFQWGYFFVFIYFIFYSNKTASLKQNFTG